MSGKVRPPGPPREPPGPHDPTEFQEIPGNDTEPPTEFVEFGGVELPIPAPASSRPPLAIPAGQAAAAFSAALADLWRAVDLVAATGAATARALDALDDWEGR